MSQIFQSFTSPDSLPGAALYRTPHNIEHLIKHLADLQFWLGDEFPGCTETIQTAPAPVAGRPSTDTFFGVTLSPQDNPESHSITHRRHQPLKQPATSSTAGASKSILLLNYEFPPLGGGAGRGTYNLARELAKKGYDVDVLTSRARGQQADEIVEGFAVHRVLSWRKGVHDCGFRGAITFVLFAVPVFLGLNRVKDYNILHYYFGLPTGVLHWLPGRHRKVPYIVSLRGSDVPGYDTFNTQLQFFHRLLLPVTRTIWNKASRIVALSATLRATALETAPDADIEIIPNGIESELFHCTTTRRKTDTVELICVARLIERKGIQHLLQALQVMQHKVHLTIVGEGNYKQKLVELSDQYQLSDKVTFHGYCPRERLVELYSASDIFVLPTMAESFGLVFIEAMSCGLPVVGTTVGGVPGIVTPDTGILVEPEDYVAVREAIDTLAGDENRRIAMGEASRDRVLAHYSWVSVTEKYEQCYAIAAGEITDLHVTDGATTDFQGKTAKTSR